MEDADGSAKALVHQCWVRVIDEVVRFANKPITKKEPESPVDRATRRTALATILIAIFTVVLAGVGYLQYIEIRDSGIESSGQMDQMIHQYRAQVAQLKRQAGDTHELAVNMKAQADRTKTIADQAVIQARAAKVAANAAQSAAETAKQTLHISERAYIHIDDPLIRWDKKAIYIPLENKGHIPSRFVHIILHIQRSTKAPNGGTYSESKWTEESIKEVAVASPVSSPGVAFDPTLVRNGHQWFSLGVVVEYNDGFSDSETRVEENAFCSNYSKDGGFVLGPCLATNALELIKKADGYPNPQNKIDQYRDLENLDRQIILPK